MTDAQLFELVYKKKLRVLIACEESQTVCKAFRARGHEAYSCDIQACSGGHPEWHIMHDAIEVAYSGCWDLMIAHPPCTYLSCSGLHYTKTDAARIQKLKDAFAFTTKLYNSPIERVCIENPVGWLNTGWRKPNQIVQPYYFGDPELKTTCFWLKGLSRLNGNPEAQRPKPIKTIIRKSGDRAGQPYNYYWRQGKSAKARSKTFPGIARAMAEQWGSNLTCIYAN